ncbi:hypothetical protein CSHISOI_00664 [Colletotrichum shisoi]|uniref:Uncharacterized protein n=1 Tax=Colletotrichum shisoi TaxID=2078593 RepID=A0A5Q4C867_9PEZI|nr:hypothetical protein CSHISOI_00664 [Colletotrichum shisoi]
MVVMMHLFASAVAPTPVPRVKVVNRDPTCGFIYAFTEPFFEDVICYEVKLDSGKWKTSFIDPKAGISKLEQTDSAIFAGNRVK